MFSYRKDKDFKFPKFIINYVMQRVQCIFGCSDEMILNYGIQPAIYKKRYVNLERIMCLIFVLPNVKMIDKATICQK